MTSPAPSPPEVDVNTVVGHDGRTYRALTIAMVDLHLRKVTERIKGSESRKLLILAEAYRQDRDHLLERRSYLMMVGDQTKEDLQ